VQVWPEGAWFGITWRRCRLVLWGTALAFAFLIAFYVLARVYLAYEVHRATSMLAELGRVRIGDGEASLLPLVSRYDGWQWTPKFAHPDGSFDDCEYVFEVNPWRFPNLAGHTRRFDTAIRAVTKAIPEGRLSSAGLRLWMAGVFVSIRSGRVHSVDANVVVEGRGEWLGQLWTLEAKSEESGSPPLAVGVTSLEIGNGGGGAIRAFLTPSASQEQVHAAHNLNAACLTSMRGCRNFCDLAPAATRYLMQHPEAATNLIPPICR